MKEGVLDLNVMFYRATVIFWIRKQIKTFLNSAYWHLFLLLALSPTLIYLSRQTHTDARIHARTQTHAHKYAI